MRSHTADQLEVIVTEPGQLYELLDSAEAALLQCPQRPVGILVTRHNPVRYTVAFSDSVPFGETREQILS